MMSIVPFFFLFFFFFLKEYILFSSLFLLGLEVQFMIFIFPLVYFLINSSFFNFYSLSNKFLFDNLVVWVLFSLSFCFSSCNSFFFLIFLENCVIFMMMLIMNFSKDFDKISSTLFMFIINIFPSILFMYFCSQWSMMDYIYEYMCLENFSFFTFLCFLGLLISKLPLFLSHFWLTKAHVSASGCGSMILASLMLKIGTMGLFKFNSVFSYVYKNFSSLSFFFVSWSMIILLLIMIRFFDLKYLVACSSIVHMAPIFCVILLGDSVGVYSSVLMMVGHGLISYLIFYIVTLLYEMGYHRSIDFNKSLSSGTKLLYMFFLFFFLMNMGFPPFPGFLSELYFLRSFFVFDLVPFFSFMFSLIFSGMFFFFVLSKSLFGKKILMENYVISFNNFIFSYFYLFIFILLPLLYI